MCLSNFSCESEKSNRQYRHPYNDRYKPANCSTAPTSECFPDARMLLVTEAAICRAHPVPTMRNPIIIRFESRNRLQHELSAGVLNSLGLELSASLDRHNALAQGLTGMIPSPDERSSNGIRMPS